jgi:hypothetical protein
MKTLTLACLACAAAALSCSTSRAQSAAPSASPPAAQAPGAWTWKKSLPAGATVELRNVNGGIEAGAAAGDTVEVVATTTGNAADLADLKVEAVEHAGGVVICVVYPAPPGEPANECKPGGGRMRIRKGFKGAADLRVKLPARARLEGRTVNGGIKVETLAGAADLQTVNGSVTVDSAAEVRARTVNGSIKASLQRTDWRGELALETVNGSVTVELPASASADVSAATVNGAINTDFGLPTGDRPGPKATSGRLGAGGRTLSVKSVNGSVNIRKRG